MLDLQFILGDFASEEILRKANVEKAKNVLILADETHQEQHEKADERTIICAHSVRFLSPKVKICAELLAGNNKSHLQRMKVEDIVVSTDYAGFILAQSAISPGIPQVLENILSPKDANTILRVKIPHNLSGRSFKDALEYFYKEKKYIFWRSCLIRS